MSPHEQIALVRVADSAANPAARRTSSPPSRPSRTSTTTSPFSTRSAAPRKGRRRPPMCSLRILLWTLWYLPAICRACAEEERDARLLARDGGAP